MKIMKFDRDLLLDEAYQRVLSQKEVKRALKRGGSLQSEVEHCLTEAQHCVEALCVPMGAILEINAEVVDDGVLLGGETLIENSRMRDEITGGAKVYLYLITCGYDSQKAFEWLQNDYSTYHFQNLIGSQLLFNIGRHLYRQVCASEPSHRFVRYSVKMQNQYAEDDINEAMALTPKYWDVVKTRSLLNLFGENTLGVSTTNAGCFSPIHAILGVMTAIQTIEQSSDNKA